ncbi:MAG: hypothetical protein HRT90_03335 [Candidatus Margulisbacteria bacterium]|nr:hypothetical protein [Candidatus Margulisiibacteriota bacterium]
MKYTLYLMVLLSTVFMSGSNVICESSSSLVSALDSKGINFDFKNTDIKTVLQSFSKHLGQKIISSKEVKGKVTARIASDKPIEALQNLMRDQGFQLSKKSGKLRVHKEKLQVNNLKTYKLKFILAEDAKEMIFGILDGEAGEKIAISKMLNTLTIRGNKNTIKLVDKLFQSMDHPPKQVLVQAKVIELKKAVGDTNAKSSLGLGWKYQLSDNVNNFVQHAAEQPLT